MNVLCGGSDSADRNCPKHLEILHVKLHYNNVSIKTPGTFNFPFFLTVESLFTNSWAALLHICVLLGTQEYVL